MGAQEQGAQHTEGRWLTVGRSLCFVRNGGDVLLMKRAPHKRIFPNQYNGVGGHIERDEDALTSARREILEETGLHTRNLRLCAVYNIDTGMASGITLFVFLAESDTRETVDSEEGTLEWVPLGEIESRDLVEDVAIILPRILALKPGDPPLYVHVSYDADDQIVLRFGGAD
ncbi:MAG: NUDIX domain-containing protein [Anaerolineae bacterium]|nr:NUDIX domain-containing protein [Anaerolineae bacterium]